MLYPGDLMIGWFVAGFQLGALTQQDGRSEARPCFTHGAPAGLKTLVLFCPES